MNAKKCFDNERFLLIYGDEMPNPRDIRNCLEHDLSMLTYGGGIYDGVMVLNTDIFNNDLLSNLEKENIYTSITTIKNTFIKNNNLLDNFIINIIELCDYTHINNNNFSSIWNTCKNYLIFILNNMMTIFKLSLDILITNLAKEKPDLLNKSSSISNSIINFLAIEIDMLNNKLSI